MPSRADIRYRDRTDDRIISSRRGVTYRQCKWHGATAYVLYLDRPPYGVRIGRANILFSDTRVTVTQITTPGMPRQETIRGDDRALVEARLREFI